MKKIIPIIIALTIMPIYATTMCVTNDSVSVVLDPSINGTNSGSDVSTGTWWTQFPYGRISGVSACINSKHGKSRGGTVSYLTDTNNEGETKLVIGGEKYGQYCWCKMTRPVVSKWAFGDGDSPCSSRCPLYCSLSKNFPELRIGLFSSN